MIGFAPGQKHLFRPGTGSERPRDVVDDDSGLNGSDEIAHLQQSLPRYAASRL